MMMLLSRKLSVACACYLLFLSDEVSGGTTKSNNRLPRGLRTRRARTLYGNEFNPDQNFLVGSFVNSREGTLESTVDLGVSTHHNYYDRKSCKSGKGGKNACAPTTSPSAAPSPSPTVSLAPSVPPSAQPSPTPTLSTAPSAAPSRSPSATPTDQPSMTPSVSPSLSSVPSAVPTHQPSAAPSPRPTQSPSDFPSSSPSTSPSRQPTMGPSDSPTTTPSSAPSTSIAPTATVFVSDQSNPLVSTCVTVSPSSGTVQGQKLAYQYNLYMKLNANVADVRLQMKTLLHSGMSNQFLTCDFGAIENFFIVSIDSSLDDVVGGQCDTTNDPGPLAETSKCVVINAKMSMEAYFPPSRRRSLQDTNANIFVLEASQVYLQESMTRGDFNVGEIVKVAFQGFVNVQQGASVSPGSGGSVPGGVAGANRGDTVQPNNESSNVIVGSAVVAVAALCFLVVTVLSVRHRRSRQDSYLKHLEEQSVVSEMSLEKEKQAGIPLDEKVNWVVDTSNETDSLGDIMQELADEDRAHHDVHNCSSAACPVCRNGEVHPTFISATSLGIEAIADLRRQPSVLNARAKYSTPDTVAL